MLNQLPASENPDAKEMGFDTPIAAVEAFAEAQRAAVARGRENGLPEGSYLMVKERAFLEAAEGVGDEIRNASPPAEGRATYIVDVSFGQAEFVLAAVAGRWHVEEVGVPLDPAVCPSDDATPSTTVSGSN